MSKHYTASQYEPAYQPKALRNWEVPKYYCNKPRQRTGRTRVIANNTGRLLPGIPRPQTAPWGNFIGTWHLPRRIDRKTANILNESTELENKVEKCKRHIAGVFEESDSEEEPEVKADKGSEEPAATEKADVPPSDDDKQENTETKTETPEVRICPIHGPY